MKSCENKTGFAAVSDENIAIISWADCSGAFQHTFGILFEEVKGFRTDGLHQSWDCADNFSQLWFSDVQHGFYGAESDVSNDTIVILGSCFVFSGFVPIVI